MAQLLPAVFAFLAAGMVAAAVITFVVSGAAHALSRRLGSRHRMGA